MNEETKKVIIQVVKEVAIEIVVMVADKISTSAKAFKKSTPANGFFGEGFQGQVDGEGLVFNKAQWGQGVMTPEEFSGVTRPEVSGDADGEINGIHFHGENLEGEGVPFEKQTKKL